MKTNNNLKKEAINVLTQEMLSPFAVIRITANIRYNKKT